MFFSLGKERDHLCANTNNTLPVCVQTYGCRPLLLSYHSFQHVCTYEWIVQFLSFKVLRTYGITKLRNAFTKHTNYTYLRETLACHSSTVVRINIAGR